MANNLTKRIIPCLDVKEGKTVKGINFENLKTVGDPVQLAKKYSTDDSAAFVNGILGKVVIENNLK